MYWRADACVIASLHYATKVPYFFILTTTHTIMVAEDDAKLKNLKRIMRIQKETISDVKKKTKRKLSDVKLDEITKVNAIKKGAALKIAEAALKDIEEGTPTEDLPEDALAAEAEAEEQVEAEPEATPAEEPAPTEPALEEADAAAQEEATAQAEGEQPAEGEQVVEQDAYGAEYVEEAVGEGGTKTSGLAITAMIFAFVFPLLGAILGLAAMATIKKDPNLTGRGLAIAAAVIGIVLTLASITLVILQLTKVFVLI